MTPPLDTPAREWHVLSDADLAMLRFSLMRELSWFDWDCRPEWWWSKEHQTLLDVKRASALRREKDRHESP